MIVYTRKNSRKKTVINKDIDIWEAIDEVDNSDIDCSVMYAISDTKSIPLYIKNKKTVRYGLFAHSLIAPMYMDTNLLELYFFIKKNKEYIKSLCNAYPLFSIKDISESSSLVTLSSHEMVSLADDLSENLVERPHKESIDIEPNEDNSLNKYTAVDIPSEEELSTLRENEINKLNSSLNETDAPIESDFYLESYFNGKEKIYIIDVVLFNNTTINFIADIPYDYNGSRAVYSAKKKEFKGKAKTVILKSLKRDLTENIIYNTPLELHKYNFDSIKELITNLITQMETLNYIYEDLQVKQSVNDKSIDIIKHLIESKSYDCLDPTSLANDLLDLKLLLAERRDEKNSLTLLSNVKNNLDFSPECANKLRKSISTLEDNNKKGHKKYSNLNRVSDLIEKVEYNEEQERATLTKELKKKYSTVRICPGIKTLYGYDKSKKN